MEVFIGLAAVGAAAVAYLRLRSAFALAPLLGWLAYTAYAIHWRYANPAYGDVNGFLAYLFLFMLFLSAVGAMTVVVELRRIRRDAA